MPESFNIYWAGDLFDQKDLIGNELLARRTEQTGAGRYRVILPQNGEAKAASVPALRDFNFRTLLECDLLVANFDGNDLDSGTVAEFCTAKMLDLPAVLLRTDFRFRGERPESPSPWNMMCAFYPRTENVLIHSMSEWSRSGNSVETFLSRISVQLVAALDRVLRISPLLRDFSRVKAQYENVIRLTGGSLDTLFPDDRLNSILKLKFEKGVYRNHEGDFYG